ncbi:MAG: SET domain-containing protein-lysine N-methyltransferase [Candidatus Lokiarchaeota archaeon]|nr:SET domain-containing protein-lysine N-methyltransferase [Candidatus Lokiarchaeota archaeon]
MNEYIDVKYISEKKGKGAFAKKIIKKKTVIDVANVILIPDNDYNKIRKTVLYDYCYIWGDSKKPGFKNAITLSISQFINHSFKPNAKYLFDYNNNTMEFSAIKDIQEGEEITVNYNGRANDKTPIWFEVID